MTNHAKVELVHDQCTLHTFVAPGDDKNIGLQLPQHHLSLTTIYGLALVVPLSLELHTPELFVGVGGLCWHNLENDRYQNALNIMQE